MSSTTVNFNLKDAGFANFASQTLTFRLLTAGADKTDDTVILPSVVTATSAANGTGSVSLFRNGESDIDSVFEVVFPNRERAKFIIPSGSSSIHLSDLLVDNVPSGSATQQSTVFAAAIQRANHTGTQTLSTISDSGTMASQNSNSVSISGGSISGATLTGTTANLTDSSNKRFMTDAQEAKLDTVETNADVTDTTNVTAAGALMDSELADLTGVKTITMPDSTVISTFAKTILDDADAAAVKTTLGITDAISQVNFVPKSVSFTNTSAFLSVANSANLNVGTGDFSFSFAARVSATSNTPVLQKNGTAGYAVFFSNGTLKLTLNSSGTSDFDLATGLNDNKWHTYVITVDRDDTAIAYVDNVAQTGVNVSGKAGNLDNTADFQIGLVGTSPGSSIALGNYVSLHKEELTSTVAGNIYFSPDTALTAGSTQLMVDLRKADKTFSDISTNGFAVTASGVIIFNEARTTSLDEVTIGATTAAAVTGTNVLASTTLGYKTGSGGTVTQGTSKSTAVTLNKINGEIVMHAAALADDATAAFTLTNSTIAATDVVIVNVASVGTVGAYQVTVGAVAAGSCSISVLNVSGGSLSQAIKLNFAVIKAVAS